MNIDDEVLQELTDSHDELVKVCQATFKILLNAGIMKKKFTRQLDALLVGADVKPGFAERAEKSSKKVMYARIRIC